MIEEMHDFNELIEKYNDIESIFQALPMDIKRHSVRVAEYTKALFESAVEIEINIDNPEEKSLFGRLNPEYMFLIGKYHDIGLALIEGIDWEKATQKLAEDEIKKIKHHTITGAELAGRIGEKIGNKPDIFWKVLPEIIRDHHEFPDGSGYPQGLGLGTKLPVYTELVILANLFDGYSASLMLEDPFGSTFELLQKNLEEYGLDELFLTLQVAEEKFKRIFRAHQGETRIIKCPPNLVRKRANPYMALTYRPVVDPKNDRIIEIESVPVFYMGSKKEELDFEEIKSELSKAKAIQGVWKYFLYDASDLVSKMMAYDLPVKTLRIPILQGVGTSSKTFGMIKECCESGKLDPTYMCFSIEMSQIKRQSRTLLELMKSLREYGCRLMATEYECEDAYLSLVLELGISEVSLSPSMLDHLDEKNVNHFNQLKHYGVRITADGVDSGDYIEQLVAVGIEGITGTEAGVTKPPEIVLTLANTKMPRIR